MEQKAAISSVVPGSWPPNWLHGRPTTVKPASPYVSCSRSSAPYCGVRPHREATLTTSAALGPTISRSVLGVPSSRAMGTSRASAVGVFGRDMSSRYVGTPDRSRRGMRLLRTRPDDYDQEAMARALPG